jgi:Kef-type K+ transport system membrane component KefB
MNSSDFFIKAMVYLAASVVFVPIAKRLGLGSVLGYLIAGIIIGPYVLGFIGKEGQDLMHAAEFGVVMMLFLIGLELEPTLLWRLRKSIMGLGSLQVITTLILVGAVALLAGVNWKQSVAIGAIVAMSSTAIVMQSLREKGLMKTAAGQSAFSVLLFQDIAVIARKFAGARRQRSSWAFLGRTSSGLAACGCGFGVSGRDCRCRPRNCKPLAAYCS